MTRSSCKRDTKSKSHRSVKLAPVRVFSCKHPLSSLSMYEIHLKHSQRRNKTLQLSNLQFFSNSLLLAKKMIPTRAESPACLYCILKIGET